eukprot:1158369-Pelagomonas_calceolata.AAC.5
MLSAVVIEPRTLAGMSAGQPGMVAAKGNALSQACKNRPDVSNSCTHLLLQVHAHVSGQLQYYARLHTLCLPNHRRAEITSLQRRMSKLIKGTTPLLTRALPTEGRGEVGECRSYPALNIL